MKNLDCLRTNQVSLRTWCHTNRSVIGHFTEYLIDYLWNPPFETTWRNSFCSIHPTVAACTNLALSSEVDIHNGTANMSVSGCCGHQITDRCPCSGLIWGHLGLIISSSAFLFLCFSGASCREGTSMIDLGMKRCPMWRSDWILNRIQDFILNSFWLSLETPKIYSIIYLKKSIYETCSPLFLHTPRLLSGFL